MILSFVKGILSCFQFLCLYAVAITSNLKDITVYQYIAMVLLVLITLTLEYAKDFIGGRK